MSERQVPQLRAALRDGTFDASEWVIQELTDAAEMIVTNSPNIAGRAALCRSSIGDWPWLGEPERIDQLNATQWAADLLDDHSLLDDVMSQLGDEARADLARRVDCNAHPFPLIVGPIGEVSDGEITEWACDSCGSSNSAADIGITITGREGWMPLDEPITYCAPCVRLAAEALGPRT